MKSLIDWFDNRTGVRAIVHSSLYEHIPGGARWRYVWGSTLVFAFTVQAITGFLLWMAYSPSAQTAWESVYFIQYEMQFGWLLRGLHHFMAQAMIVLLALHLVQVVIDGAYRAPREVNFWLGLILMQIVLGLSLTGYLLPWDQKGFWATRVATNLMGLVPVVGQDVQRIVVGGADYGHHTLTRFFALHAGILPATLVGFLILHIAIFRRHGIHASDPKRGPDGVFWPDQILRDAVACLAVLAVVLFFIFKPYIFGDAHGSRPGEFLGADLGAPADGSTPYSAARPEWYFLFLFQFLKYFEGETLEIIGALVVPGIVMGLLFLMPILGSWKLGHRFNIGLLCVLLIGVVTLTGLAINDDYQSKWKERPELAAGESGHGEDNPLHRYEQSEQYLEAVEDAETQAERAITLASLGIPPEGMLAVMRSDPKTRGPQLFRRYCASCHSNADAEGNGIVAEESSAPNLYGFGGRDWIAGLLDPEKISGPQYFGQSPHAEGDMVTWVNDTVSDIDPDDLKKVVMALSAEAKLESQHDIEVRDADAIARGRELIASEVGCTDCHQFGEDGFTGAAPDLTGYASRDWLAGMISDPNHERFYLHAVDEDPQLNRQPMPAFAASADATQNILNPAELNIIIKWLRGEWYEPQADEEADAAN